MNASHVNILNVTPEQDTYFRKACGVRRHAFNWALARWKEARSKGERVTMRGLRTEYNQIKGEQFPWVYETTKCDPEQAFGDLGEAFDNYWGLQWAVAPVKLKHPRDDGDEAGLSAVIAI